MINSVLFQIEDRKRSWIVHHDRLKLCNDSELSIWLQRKRSLTEETGERQLTEPEEEGVLNVESLFRDTEGQTSDVPMYRNTAARETSYVRCPDEMKLLFPLITKTDQRTVLERG